MSICTLPQQPPAVKLAQVNPLLSENVDTVRRPHRTPTERALLESLSPTVPLTIERAVVRCGYSSGRVREALTRLCRCEPPAAVKVGEGYCLAPAGVEVAAAPNRVLHLQQQVDRLKREKRRLILRSLAAILVPERREDVPRNEPSSGLLRCILAKATAEPQTARKLIQSAGYKFNSNSRAGLTALVKDGRIRRACQGGYCLPSVKGGGQ